MPQGGGISRGLMLSEEKEGGRGEVEWLCREGTWREAAFGM